MDFMNPSMSPSSSESSIAHVDENKTMVMAAAYAAGLNKGGIRRAAFSMGDLQVMPGLRMQQARSCVTNITTGFASTLQALQPADSGEFCSKPQPASTPLATVPEGQPAVITSLPSGAMLQPQQYVLVPVSSITSDAMGR